MATSQITTVNITSTSAEALPAELGAAIAQEEAAGWSLLTSYPLSMANGGEGAKLLILLVWSK